MTKNEGIYSCLLNPKINPIHVKPILDLKTPSKSVFATTKSNPKEILFDPDSGPSVLALFTRIHLSETIPKM